MTPPRPGEQRPEASPGAEPGAEATVRLTARRLLGALERRFGRVARALALQRGAHAPVATGAPARTSFVPLEDEADLEGLFARSAEGPVLVLNHDPYCPISTRAFTQVRRLGVQAALVDVAHRPALARMLAQRTGVRHESPQAIVLHAGAAVWHASHHAITARSVERALAGASATEASSP